MLNKTLWLSFNGYMQRLANHLEIKASFRLKGMIGSQLTTYRLKESYQLIFQKNTTKNTKSISTLS
jgi:hypothetical protein